MAAQVAAPAEPEQPSLGAAAEGEKPAPVLDDRGTVDNLEDNLEEVGAEVAEEFNELVEVEHDAETGEKTISYKMRTLFESVIILNSIQVGVCAEHEVFAPCYAVENVFAVVYLFEVWVKAKLLGNDYWTNAWHRVDIAVIILALGDAWLFVPFSFIIGVRKEGNLALLFRLMKVIRLLRIIRILKNRKRLLLILRGLFSAFRALVWVGILVALLVYCGAVFCVTAFKHDIPPGETESPWAQIWSSIYYLFALSILPEFSEDTIQFLTDRHWFAYGFFVVFAVLANITLLNLCIGIICESISSVMADCNKDEELERERRVYNQIKATSHLLFKGRERITKGHMKKFSRGKGQKHVEELVSQVNLPRGFSFHDLHGVFDRDGTGTITEEEFLRGMHRIIFCNDNQRILMMQSTLSDLMKEVKRAELNIIQETRLHRAELNKEATPTRIGFKDYCEHMRPKASDTESSEEDMDAFLTGAKAGEVSSVPSRTSVMEQLDVEETTEYAKDLVQAIKGPLADILNQHKDKPAEEMIAKILATMNDPLTKAVQGHMTTVARRSKAERTKPTTGRDGEMVPAEGNAKRMAAGLTPQQRPASGMTNV